MRLEGSRLVMLRSTTLRQLWLTSRIAATVNLASVRSTSFVNNSSE